MPSSAKLLEQMTRLQGRKELGSFKALRVSQMRYNVMGKPVVSALVRLCRPDCESRVQSVVMVNVMFLEQCHHSWFLMKDRHRDLVHKLSFGVDSKFCNFYKSLKWEKIWVMMQSIFI